MRIEEAILFLVVVALSLSLVVVVVAPNLRQKRRSSPGSGLAPGAVDARAGAGSLAGGQACPACHRHQPAEFRFCPLDGTPLGLRLPIDGEAEGLAIVQDGSGAQDRSGATSPAPGGKICPSCSRRYRLDTGVCPRDGAALVAVN